VVARQLSTSFQIQIAGRGAGKHRKAEGHAYTFAELERISQDAGFARVELAPPEIGIDRLVIAFR
jgi:hypothetical protein